MGRILASIFIEVCFRITLDLIDFNNGLSEDSNLMKWTADCGVSLKINDLLLLKKVLVA